jgi:hypothetical protein
VSSFLREHLIPPAKAEDAVLYPEVERAMAAPRAMVAMRRDHVAALTAELGEIEGRITETVSHADETDARRVLNGLYAPVKLHFARKRRSTSPSWRMRSTPTTRARCSIGWRPLQRTRAMVWPQARWWRPR